MSAEQEHKSEMTEFRPLPVVVISAPSGAGKTTIARALLERHPSWRFSVSATTRPMRPHERDGIDYHFLDRSDFEAIRDAGGMVEWEEIFGNLYGTLASEIDRRPHDTDNSAIICDLDVKGAISMRRRFPQQTFLVFVAPPSIDVLKERLVARSTESSEVVDRRLSRAAMELAMTDEFDTVVVNDSLDTAIDSVDRFVEARIEKFFSTEADVDNTNHSPSS